MSPWVTEPYYMLRAVELGADHEHACASVAQAMHIATEPVEDIAWTELQVSSEVQE